MSVIGLQNERQNMGFCMIETGVHGCGCSAGDRVMHNS